MPELPEVEAAVEELASRAQAIASLRDSRLLHPALTPARSAARAALARGARVARVERRGKHQLLHLEDGAILHAHFRMNGDWELGDVDAPLPRFARAVHRVHRRLARGPRRFARARHARPASRRRRARPRPRTRAADRVLDGGAARRRALGDGAVRSSRCCSTRRSSPASATSTRRSRSGTRGSIHASPARDRHAAAGARAASRYRRR